MGKAAESRRRDSTYWAVLAGSAVLAIFGDLFGIMRALLSLNPEGARHANLDEIYPVSGLKAFRQRGRYHLRYPGDWLGDESIAFSKQAAAETPTLRQRKRIVPDAAFGSAGAGIAPVDSTESFSDCAAGAVRKLAAFVRWPWKCICAPVQGDVYCCTVWPIYRATINMAGWWKIWIPILGERWNQERPCVHPLLVHCGSKKFWEIQQWIVHHDFGGARADVDLWKPTNLWPSLAQLWAWMRSLQSRAVVPWETTRRFGLTWM